MYKKQMTLQRIVCYLLLAASAIVFIYSLGLMTDMYDNKFNLLSEYKVAGTEIYHEMQDFNRSLTVVGIVLLLLAVSQFVAQNHARRKYYIANYITVGVTSVANVAATVWALIKVFSYRTDYLQVNFEGEKGVAYWADILNFEYTTSTFWFDISIPVFIFLLLVTALSIFNTVLKVMLMKEEASLLTLNKEENVNA